MASCALDYSLILHGTTPNRGIEFKAVSSEHIEYTERLKQV